MASQTPGIVAEITEEICRIAHVLKATGMPERSACDIAFDAVIAALAETSPDVLSVYRAAITVRHPAIFAHLN